MTMRWIILFSSSNRRQQPPRKQYNNLNHLRTLFEGTFKAVRDRGLDHAVEREKHLKPLISLKNLIKREPSKSLPISIVTQNKESLQLPFRPVEFTRKYPSVFHEFLPVAAALNAPHIRLTPQALSIDSDEQLLYQSDGYKEQIANRLLKLLMISRIHKIPLSIIEHLKWDLGLPHDYLHGVIPEFPDYFRVVQEKSRAFRNDDDRVLELVCWSNELAVSVMEKKNKKKGSDSEFPVQFSTGFEMDRSYQRWLSQWQKLPYVSPYENAAHLSASSDESDRWVVGVLHEILHVLVPKKTEKDNLLILGDWLGLRSRFKRALLQHPGIFYLSSKIGTQTVVLREGYKRGSLAERHPFMDLRSQYIHLMNTIIKEDGKDVKVVLGKINQDESNDKDLEEGRVKPVRDSKRERSAGRSTQKFRERNPSEASRRLQIRGRNKDVESSVQRSRSSKSRGKCQKSKPYSAELSSVQTAEAHFQLIESMTMRRIILFSSSNRLQQPPRKQYNNLNHLRPLFEGTFKAVRDRGLDHAVEREKHLKPLISLKNLIKREPSKSLPISIITQNKESLQLPFRPIEFTRKYPSVFHEFLPVAAALNAPHIRLTPQALSIDSDEQLLYQSDGYKEQIANRLLKLLMISRIHKIPLSIIEHLKWDLGLPHDYLHGVIPEFPDYFRVVHEKSRAFRNDDDRVLELVCWSNELAVSVMEKKNKKKGSDFEFPVQFSTGFEMDRSYQRWLSQWQKLPYVSPYENAAHLSASSDESDRWVVGVLHEILHVLVPKKTEKDNLLILGDWLGLRSRFKRALLKHPGIFYLSSKIGTQTVVLREGYKRGSLAERHPFMDLRSQYIHLMNTTIKEDGKDVKRERSAGRSTQKFRERNPSEASRRLQIRGRNKDFLHLFDLYSLKVIDALSHVDSILHIETSGKRSIFMG
ncbi:hypothetical protein Ahy_A05g021756 isoform B [Arachis hypogaea]|uniref:PORR domain-containing protein n=1 Tax=Arachis hypogaea TaxID=3818 RepID=A0A445CYD0_ARAHY|nr:hypothetical protein Ahy_A05g021756 isoform B [Arachis hypogaea]